MRFIHALALTSTLLLAPEVSLADTPVPPPQAAGYRLMFFDDFVNLNLSPNGSGLYAWYKGLPWETPPAQFNASVDSSVLTLAWEKGQKLAETTIKSCSHNGQHCPAFRYGYFEARMKWDVTTGAWPAFWMLPAQSISGATETGELDVFEGQGDPYDSQTYYGTIHDWVVKNGAATDVANNGHANHYKIPGVDFSAWHTYGVLWVPGKVTWYFDDQPIITATTYPIFDQQNFFLLLGSQEGASWTLGNLKNVTSSGMNLNVDWVRVWQQ